MKKILLLVLILVLASCSRWGSSKDNFIDTYTDIYKVRYKYTDSVTANKQVELVLKNHGYTKTSFRNDYFKYAKNPSEFLIMLDTARTRAGREIFNYEKNKFKTKEN